uniref:Uncharacterized protein n=1 Tax=Rhodnius prolixus TaxID=13249 RepID=T1HIV4_RHOPR
MRALSYFKNIKYFFMLLTCFLSSFFERMGKLFCSRFPLMRPSLYDDEEKKRMKKQKKEGKHRTRAGGVRKTCQVFYCAETVEWGKWLKGVTETKRGVHFFSVLAHRKEARITSLATAIKVKKLEGSSVVRNKRKAREKDEGRAERCTSKGRSMPLGVRDEKALVLFPLTLGTRLNHQERSFYIPNFSPEGFPEKQKILSENLLSKINNLNIQKAVGYKMLVTSAASPNLNMKEY